jgi:putative Mg2+ transporter-C (MgtC) family protein
MAVIGAASNSWALDEGVIARLLVAALLGGLVGIEREASDQPAGLRTHIAVALGAALFGVISTIGFLEFDRPRNQSTIQADVSRVASNVAVGIGFLGAGVIFRQGGSIRNLTTGASLWVVAAIGLAAGVGDVATAGVATGVLLVSLVLLRPIRTFIRRRLGENTCDLRVELDDGSSASTVVDAIENHDQVSLGSIEIDMSEDHTVVAAKLRCEAAAARELTAALAGRPGVRNVTQE